MSGRELAPEPEQWRRVHPLQEARPLRQLGARALFQTSDKVGEAENKVKVYKTIIFQRPLRLLQSEPNAGAESRPAKTLCPQSEPTTPFQHLPLSAAPTATATATAAVSQQQT